MKFTLPDVRFLMVGSATKPEFCEKIKEEIAALHHPDKVLLMGFREDVEKVIAANEVIVKSPPWEPRSQVIHQSLIMKALVVASNKAKLIGGHYKRSNMAAIG